MPAQIAIMDLGGQYCHMISRRLRDLGCYSDIIPHNTDVSVVKQYKGVIISGGPQSVYDEKSLTIDPAVLAAGIPVLGICYGMQLITKLLGGVVEQGEVGEYGPICISIVENSELLADLDLAFQVWNNHRDLVVKPPRGFRCIASSPHCPISGMEDSARRIYAVQFHPEVWQTGFGPEILRNFLNVCGYKTDWDEVRMQEIIKEYVIRTVGDRRVMFFVSGGVDSLVAFTITKEILGPDRVDGFFIDTGFMRTGESDFIDSMNFGQSVQIVKAHHLFVDPLFSVIEPEQKRHIIGAAFVKVQQQLVSEYSTKYGDNWVLGQGTIYPDIIESGGSASADTIKTHHNRVPEILELIKQGRVVEPLQFFYKDEVRRIGSIININEEYLNRHPFPGPGLAIRILGSPTSRSVVKYKSGYIVPIKTVGVKGDSRSYQDFFMFNSGSETMAKEDFTAANKHVNRIVREEISRKQDFMVMRASTTTDRIARLQKVDEIVTDFLRAEDLYDDIWQMPVILIPLGTLTHPDSVVLRPVSSTDGMTVDPYRLPRHIMRNLLCKIMTVEGIYGVYYDITSKPPGCIEWE